MKLKGLLVVNNFVNAGKFREIYGLLSASAEKQGLELRIIRTGQLLHNIECLKDLDCDFILFWDKDYVLAKQLELAGHRVFNSAEAILCCDNKAYMSMGLQKNGIRIPDTYIAPLTFEGLGYNNLDFAYEIAGRTGYPLVIKELYGSFGQQVYLADSEQRLREIIAGIGSRGFLLQKFIKTSYGRDIRVNVVGDKVVAAMLRFNDSGDFRSNITIGGKSAKIDITGEQGQIAVAACRALGLDYAGVDILFGEYGNPVICEVNSNPHFKSTYECTGKDMSEDIFEYIRKKLREGQV